MCVYMMGCERVYARLCLHLHHNSSYGVQARSRVCVSRLTSEPARAWGVSTGVSALTLTWQPDMSVSYPSTRGFKIHFPSPPI